MGSLLASSGCSQVLAGVNGELSVWQATWLVMTGVTALVAGVLAALADPSQPQRQIEAGFKKNPAFAFKSN